MSSCVCFIFVFFFSFHSIFRASAQKPYYLNGGCQTTTSYSRNSTYSTNLQTLFSSLSSPNASYSTGFQNATAGNVPDRVTGLFLCRGDYSPEICRSCVVFAVNESLVRCPDKRAAVFYYEECILRYSDENILSTVTYDGGLIMENPNNFSSNQRDWFVATVSSTLNQAAVLTAKSSRKFYTIETELTPVQTLNGLLQCTPDLTRQECLSCLQSSIKKLDLSRVGGRYVYPSCTSRYELYSFYEGKAIRTLPPSPRPPSPLPSSPPMLSPAPTPSLPRNDITTIESLQLDYRMIRAATNKYSENNKIGQGGFGEVFKGIFPNGTQVAVKRLSKSSGQGHTEFKNEVIVVAKLQHRNLVRLLGFSLEGEERILVYEYVPNKSLDYFLCDPVKQGQLDWTRRQKIIEGITRGILYLHQDSRLTIIHRDLKASNILLDADMNPKISDFGMARIFEMDQTQENTSKIVGTFGYMSPEYAIHGLFSVKSDVYSFGVLVLEIISGKKNIIFNETNDAHDLVTYAWRQWSKGTTLDLVDPVIIDNCQESEIVRCIHIGLLCVQEDPENRPIMSTIFMMLTNNTVTLPIPQQPWFFVPEKDSLD
ncbi:PREDICTED: cysteine-rich receptor-like protein kinase 15 isoform X2 [Camelina sativa]|uniref:Cysteine-rich receptor-like protein kinase 15 isoform X2 n=1 Tax=Camelina sativa TaxID=90675 RepID=A0ABM0UCM2_CAMSA|nr:PREDICTED: cysteine-rich receptor-like protein kinase 15 isoform X2 [Camelina sativa]